MSLSEKGRESVKPRMSLAEALPGGYKAMAEKERRALPAGYKPGQSHARRTSTRRSSRQ